MIWLSFLLLLLLPLVLLLVYPLAIQYERGGACRLLLPLYLAAGLVDVVLNYTTLALCTWDFPRAGEYTFSKRLSRLVRSSGWRRVLAQLLKAYLDAFDPKGVHVL